MLLKELNAHTVFKYIHGEGIEAAFWDIQKQIDEIREWLIEHPEEKEENENEILEKEKVARAILEFYGIYFYSSKEMEVYRQYYNLSEKNILK